MKRKTKLMIFFYFSDARGTLYKTYQEYWSFDLRRSVIMHRLGNRLFAKSTLKNKTELYFARSDYRLFKFRVMVFSTMSTGFPPPLCFYLHDE